MPAALYQLGPDTADAAPPAGLAARDAAGAASALLHEAQVATLYRCAASSTLTVVASAAALWLALWAFRRIDCRVCPAMAPLFAWALAVHTMQALLLLCLLLHRRAPDAVANARRWRLRHHVALGLHAAAWGSAAWWLLPAADAPQLTLITLVLLGAAACGMPATTACRGAVLLWLLPSTVPLAAALLRQGGSPAQALAALCAGHLALMLLLARRQHHALLGELKARLAEAASTQRLHEQVQRAVDTSRDKSRFLASASHDLRQPLHALGLFASALDRRVTDPAGRPLVRNINRCIEALDRSFNAMLDISKLDAGVVEADLQSFPIRDVFRRLHMHFAGQAEALGLDLRFKPGGKFVRSDPQLLERVLGNLIQNALRYTAKGGIVVLARSRGAGVNIEVWDTGRGMAQAELPRVFDEFYRGESSAAARVRGLGMGLAIVKRLVLLLGHPLTVRSTPGRGTMVGVWAPRTDLDALHGMNLEAETVPHPLGGMGTLLVVDDDDRVRAGTALLLAQWGYDVVAAESAESACRAALAHADTLQGMVCDLRLQGGEDGLHTIARVRDLLGHPLPAVLVTGDTTPEQVARVHDSGHPALFKPVRPRELYAALRRMT